MSRRPPAAAWLAVLVALLALIAGCATVPQSSDVQVLRRVGEGSGPRAPAGPVDGVNPLDLVRGFVSASGPTGERHQVAREFLTRAAVQSWDDGASLTVLDDQFDTVYAALPANTDSALVRVRATRLGRLSSSGAFNPNAGPVELDIGVARQDGQWRISDPPPGVNLRLGDFRINFKPAAAYFVDSFRRTTVADPRYLPSNPATSLPSQAMDALLAGPSPALLGAAASQLRPGAVLRSNVADASDGALVVDLTQLGDLDDGQRRLVAAQVVLTLAEVSVSRIRLLADGVPLVANHPVWGREDVASLVPDLAPRPDVPALVVSGGRLRVLGGDPVPGPAGAGSYDAQSAALSADGAWLAVAGRVEGRSRLFVGRSGEALAPVALEGPPMSRPTWNPGANEVWTVAGGGAAVTRVMVDPAGGFRVGPVDAAALAALGRITDLRLSRDGARAAAVVGGRLVVGAIARGGAGEVAVRNPRVLLAGSLTDLVGVDWMTTDQVVVASARADRPVATAAIDGLEWSPTASTNLTVPLTAVAAAPGRPLVVADQNGLWTFPVDGSGIWRLVPGGVAGAVPGYPG